MPEAAAHFPPRVSARRCVRGTDRFMFSQTKHKTGRHTLVICITMQEDKRQLTLAKLRV